MRFLLVILALIFSCTTLPCPAHINPVAYIEYCKPECSKKTKIFANADKRLICYERMPYGARKYGRLAVRIAEHFGLDPAIFCAQIECESGWHPSMVSMDGGYGLTQVTGIPNPDRLLEPEYNMVVGAQIALGSYRMAEQLFNCSIIEDTALLALRIYNGGTRFLKKELSFLDNYGINKCNLFNQMLVCARDLCLWRVNISYPLKILNSSVKYRGAIWN